MIQQGALERIHGHLIGPETENESGDFTSAGNASRSHQRRGASMKQVNEYLRRAEECRALAIETQIAGHRKKIEAISDAWLKLAEERLEYLKDVRLKGSPKRDP
jgi:cyanate lyase